MNNLRYFKVPHENDKLENIILEQGWTIELKPTGVNIAVTLTRDNERYTTSHPSKKVALSKAWAMTAKPKKRESGWTQIGLPE